MRAVLPISRLMLLAALALPVQAAAVDRSAYGNAVRLIEKLYLRPGDVTPHDLLFAAARGLADRVDWLMVDSSGTDVSLRHGDGSPVGAVSVGSWEGLPDALYDLEQVVADAGHPLGDVDVRLELLKGLTDGLDRYSRVLHGEGRERFEVRLSGEYEGIGATLDQQGDHLVVTHVIAEGPAAQGGLRVDDVVLRIDDRSTVGMPVGEAVRLVRGEVGTQIALTVLRGGEEHVLALTRARVTEPNVRSDLLADGVGYVHISHVSQRTVENLQEALAGLRERGGLDRGIVVDLRGNTGGSMKEAARAADVFLKEGLLLRTEGPDGGRVQNLQAEMRAEDGGDEPPIPVVLVVDDRTASGSEIMAGALLELERAALVGTRTYGKGTVQKIYTLDAEAQLKLTVAQYVLANQRLIADVGIVPDVVVGRVELDRYGVRFHDFDEGEQRTPWASIVPMVAEDEGWRGQRAERVDLPVEIARRAVLKAHGTSRAAVLTALEHVAAEVRSEQEQHLLEALEAHEIDWAAAPEEGAEEAGFMEARVEVTAAPDAGRSDVYQVKAKIRNTSDEPLHRVLVELDCPSFYAWDDVVIPVGLVPPGQEVAGEVAVPLPPGIDPREDPVTVRLRADGRPPLLVGEEVLASRSSQNPELSVSARLVPHGEGLHRAEITVHNLAGHPISGIEAKFAYPRGLDVELVDMAARIPVLTARGEERLDLTLRLGGKAPDELPLDLEIDTERYRSLVSWPLELPLDGRVVALRAPRVKARNPVVSAPVGRFGLPLVVNDETELDHVVVYANGRKIAWAPGGKAQVELRPEVDLYQGVNRILVVAEDEHGIRERRWFYIRGEPPASVDAEEP